MKSHIDEATYLFRTVDEKNEERCLDISQRESDISRTMPVLVRLMVSEDLCSIQMQMSTNDKVSDVVEELAEFATENKYKLTIVKDGKPLKMTDSLAENHVS